MMIQLDIQMSAHIGQFGRIDIPSMSCKVDSTKKSGFRYWYTGIGTAGMQYRPVKRGVVGSDKIDP